MMMKQRTQMINGIEYVYVDLPYWDTKKKCGSHKREYIGRMVDGIFVPNKKYKLQQELEQAKVNLKPGPVSTEKCLRYFYGATWLLDCISKKYGITADLKNCFPDDYLEIQSIAYYLVLEDGSPLYRFDHWAKSHKHPFAHDIPSQRSSELFGRISEDAKMDFFQRQSLRRMEKEYIAFDSTSISSYSKLLKQAKYGKNKEHDPLPQINLLLLYGEESMMPVYYRKLCGNITDVKTVHNLLKDVDFLKMDKLNLVMDRGFYSEDNINALFKYHHKFIIGVRTSLKLVRKHLDPIRDTMPTRSNYHRDDQIYWNTFSTEWDYIETKPRKSETITDKRRIYLHIYFNDQHATDDRIHFNKMLDNLEEELKSGHRNAEHEKLYAKYFDIHETPERGIILTPKEDAIKDAEKDFGFFALLSNGVKDPSKALHIYRSKDQIEKSFGNLKEKLSMRRMSVASEENFEGKLFIQFMALIYLSFIKKKMTDKGLFQKYTMQELLDELDTVEWHQQPGKQHHLSEITTKQQQLYEALEIEVPS